ncbi:hypothetical protein QVD17_23229 [Tagetes erecta]|uniref:Uncharacterized protein n=1 Tax=Tagetes erecta TaxID=13708 RepID=A0AAD8KHC6_TARER|nr:hypothetical protein QVD17_23229 [Tagetes erecta]
MSLICNSCPGHIFHPSYGKRTRNMATYQARLYVTQPVINAIATSAPTFRRSANYPPSIWSYDYLQSLSNNFVAKNYETKLHTLKESVRLLIFESSVVDDPLSALELVDDLQRLGISYHFNEEIRSVLKMIYAYHFKAYDNRHKLNLTLKALGFRLLRQHGYNVPQEIIEMGNIMADVEEDMVGMLNLYEASFFGVENENILDEAREFTTKCLREKIENNIGDESILMLISHALELPLLWRVPRFEAMWFIEAYRRRSNKKSSLLELAELDFNILQGVHQEDLKNLSRWWEGLGWHKKLSFGRDRLVESFMWSVGASYQASTLDVTRTTITKVISLVNVIDDMYDVYGTLDELEQFTNIVRRWDVNAIEELPHYMKICFLGLYNTINEMAYNTLTNRELLVIPHVKKLWIDYCEANLVEARWFNSGYTPTLEEYLKNSCVTISLPLIISNLYFLTSSDITGEVTWQNAVQCSAMILRLADDLGTSMAEHKRGDIPKSIQCYMHESGACEEKAREHIKKLIMETWKKLNKERVSSSINCSSSSHVVEYATNLGRMAQFTYQLNDDAFGSPDECYKSHAISLLFKPKS